MGRRSGPAVDLIRLPNASRRRRSQAPRRSWSAEQLRGAAARLGGAPQSTQHVGNIDEAVIAKPRLHVGGDTSRALLVELRK